jgi:PiT family inorganic phosphate transporter
MHKKQDVLYVEVEKLRELKADLAACSKNDYKRQVELFNEIKNQKKQVKKIKKTLRDNYVKRGMVKKIVTAWVITVPAAAVLSAIIFYALEGATIS